MLSLGFVVNPVSGIGGTVGLKGSDGVVGEARGLGGTARAIPRVEQLLGTHPRCFSGFRVFTWAGAMGGGLLSPHGIDAEVIGEAPPVTTSEDTCAAVDAFVARRIDLIVFVGGDGTARDVAARAARTPIIGLPAGVKMHSGVFVRSPARLAEILGRVRDGGLVAVRDAEIRDLDEAALRRGVVRSRFYADVKVPDLGDYVQHTKIGGVEDETLAQAEIAAYVADEVRQSSSTFLLGPGSTVSAIKSELGSTGTLLGFDLFDASGCLETNLAERRLLELGQFVVVVSFTRGQGALIGRGNLELSIEVLARLRREDLWVVGTRNKLASLDGRPLLVDSGSATIDQRFSGLIEVIAGFDDKLFVRSEN